MHCKPTGDPSPLQVRNRQMAVLYLHAAQSASDAVAQEKLRRRAVQLLAAPPVDRPRRLAS